MYCPNGKIMKFKYRKAIKGNKYGREEENYECEDCSNCPFASQCKKTEKNRIIRINKATYNAIFYVIRVETKKMFSFELKSYVDFELFGQVFTDAMLSGI